MNNLKREIYFDNCATTYPKPPSVSSAVLYAIKNLGGNPGRSGHVHSLRASEAVYSSRVKVAEFFGAEPENVVFTSSCTHSLNLAIKGVCRKNSEILISSLEHNSVARPCVALEKNGCTLKVFRVEDSDEKTIENFKKAISEKADVVVITVAGNVTGQILPIKELCEIAHKNNAVVILDSAQGAGVLDIGLSLGADFICMPGHKGLFGIRGTGILISNGKYKLNTIIEGGTGATSSELDQTDFMPERLESGTLGVPGICSIKAGIEYIELIGRENIHSYESELCDMFIDGIKNIDDILIYRDGENFAPIVAFNNISVPSNYFSGYLNDCGFSLRGGLHCSPLAHKTIGTLPEGCVRFSPSVFNSQKEVELLINSIKKFSKNRN